MEGATVRDEQAVSFSEKFYERLYNLRRIGNPCVKCNGLGSRTYGSTATWRGGIGGAAMTTAVCDKCWGSGSDRPWYSHREFEDLKKELEVEKFKNRGRVGT